MTPEQASELADVLANVGAKISDNGVRISIYTGKQRTKDGSREFDSTFFFVSNNEKKASAPAKPAARFVPRTQVKTLG